MLIAEFLINELNRFSSFKGRDLNSHSERLDIYRRMLAVFLPMRQKLMGGELTGAQITAIMKARFHPDERT